MSKIKGDTEITTEYVNNKLEQVLSALFDTLNKSFITFSGLKNA